MKVVLPKQVIPFATIESWLKKHATKNAESIAKQTKPILDSLDDAIFAAQENLKKLSHAELRNKSISARELAIMKGNRDSYIVQTKKFLEKLASLYDKEAITYADIKHFVKTYEYDVEILNKALFKPYAVLQHFFAHESYAVAQQIKKIDQHLQELKLILQKESEEAIDDCYKQIMTITRLYSEQEKCLEQRKKLRDDHARLTSMTLQAQHKLAKVEASDGYKKYCALVADFEEHEKKIQEHNQELTHLFATLDKALRKFIKKELRYESLIEAYLNNTVKALYDDKAFTIISVLEAVKHALDELELKDDKKIKTNMVLDTLLTPGFFQAFLQKDTELYDTKHQMEKNIKNHFSVQQYKEASYMLQTYQEKSATVQQELDIVNNDLAKIDIHTHIIQLEKDIHSCTKFEVKITLI